MGKIIYLIKYKSLEFKTFRSLLLLDSFKWANWLLLFASICILVIHWFYYPASVNQVTTSIYTITSDNATVDEDGVFAGASNATAIATASAIAASTATTTNNNNNAPNNIASGEAPDSPKWISWSPWHVWIMTLVCVLYFIPLNYVISKIAKDGQPQASLTKLQIISLISSSIWVTILSVLDKHLVTIQPAIMFIIYTLLAIDSRKAFRATIVANLIHLISYTMIEIWLIQIEGNHNNNNSIGISPYSLLTKQLFMFTTCYILFHIVGIHLNYQSQENCRKSFDEIQNSVSDRTIMDTEDKTLTKLMESVIPKFLASRMRDDIISSESKGNFYNIYLEFYDEASILFADIVNFTKISSACSAQLLVETLNELFGRFDQAADRNHCLRIKILGDCYYCVCGIPDMSDEHAVRSVEMGLDMIDILGDLAQDNTGVDLNMRVGIHSGRLLCGVLGKKKWQFDVHSNDVKLANHMEQAGIPGRVHITEDTLKALGGRYQVEPANGHLRDTYIAQRNMSTYFVIPPPGRRASLASVRSIPSQVFRTKLATPGPIPMPQVQVVTTPHPTAPTMTIETTGVAGRLSLGSSEAAITGATSAASSSRQLQQDLSPAPRPVASNSLDLQHIRPQLPAHQAKLRFKNATLRIINALHFIKTIDAPFANLDTPKMNKERMLKDTISSRCNIQDIHPISLQFRDVNMAQLYRTPTTQLRNLLIYLSLFAWMIFLSTQTMSNLSAHDLRRVLVQVTIVLIVFLSAILVYIHQTELNSRRDFLWRQISIRDKAHMARIRDCNRYIFFNILPPHVADYFLAKRNTGSHLDLYHKSYDRIGVVFAAISNFSDFYSEVQGNNHGLECLRVLNEIICDFDSILDDQRFKAVDKIKTIGSTYMAAIGLFPELELPSDPIEPQSVASTATTNSDSMKESDSFNHQSTLNQQPQAQQLQDTKFTHLEARREVARYLHILVGFVLQMKVRLQEINEHSFNCFKLRVGINLGPVTAGVIGASKPQYDIWGNTVNVASRMESTAEANKIQITEEVYDILKDFNEQHKFKFTCRGSINVKGKGYMTTYYLDEH